MAIILKEIKKENKLPVIQKLTFTIQFLDKGYLPPFSGHLLRGLLYKIIASVDPLLVELFHEKSKRRPYTISSIKLKNYQSNKRIKRTGEIKIDQGDLATFTVTLIGSNVQQRVIQTAVNSTVKEPEIFLLPIQIISIEIKKQIWTHYDTPSGIYYLDFHTPTQFKNTEGNLFLFPDPERLFSSLAKIWLELIPEIKIEIDAIRKVAKKFTYIRTYDLKTKSVHLGKIGEQTGFRGRISLVIKENDNEINLNWLPYLLQLGNLLNIGNYRIIGMGQFTFRKRT